MELDLKRIGFRRQAVMGSYNCAVNENQDRYLAGDEKATAEYVFENQMVDAHNIVNEFYANKRRVVSVSKLTKVGMDGLMIEVAKLMTTHPDDEFVLNYNNIRIITGMSNAGWEKDMKDKAPSCFKDKIFHHGQLRHANLRNLKDALIIIDEIDNGDKEAQVLHNTLKEAGVLNVEYMENNNVRFMFASATMVRELYQLYRWGDLHTLYTMTIPPNYIGHIDFLRADIIREFYPLHSSENAAKWIKEDVIDHYGDDFRVHIVRVNPTTVGILRDECIRANVHFRNHTSVDRMTDEEVNEIFKLPLKGHVVMAVKGFFRRANLIPNAWKLRIGATHELYTKTVDNSVQIQGLPGRMSGYWRDVIDAGHKTGPHRTSIQAIEEYSAIINDPFGNNSYRTAGFTKTDGTIGTIAPTMVDIKNVEGISPCSLPDNASSTVPYINSYRIYDNENSAKRVCGILGYSFNRKVANGDTGFIETSLNARKCVASLADAVRKVNSGYGGKAGGGKVSRTFYPCYVDVNDNTTLRYVVIIRPDTHDAKIQEADEKCPGMPFIA